MSKERQQGFKDRYSKDPRDPQREIKQAVDLGGTSGTTTTTTTPTSSSAPSKITETSRLQRRVQQQKLSSGGVVILRNYPFDAVATRRVIFDGKTNDKLSDIIFCNTSRTDAITFERRITTLDIDNIPQNDRTISEYNIECTLLFMLSMKPTLLLFLVFFYFETAVSHAHHQPSEAATSSN